MARTIAASAESPDRVQTHITILDQLLAVSRNEWRCIDEERRWELAGTFPDIVIRHYGRDDVRLRDHGRMIELGYMVAETRSYEGHADHDVRVTYRRRAA